MRRNLLQDARENLPLHFLQARLRRFNQANRAGALGQYAVMIMTQPSPLCPEGESLQVGEPAQFTRPYAEPAGQVPLRFDWWNAPRHSRRNRLHLLRTGQPLDDFDFFEMLRACSPKLAI